MLKVRDDKGDDVKVVKESKAKAKPRTKAKMKFGNKNKKKGKKKNRVPVAHPKISTDSKAL